MIQSVNDKLRIILVMGICLSVFSIIIGVIYKIFSEFIISWEMASLLFISLFFLSIRTLYELKKIIDFSFLQKFLILKSYLSLIVLGLIITTFIILNIPSLNSQEYDTWDSQYVKPYLESCNLFELPQERALLKFYQFCVSKEIFGNPKIIPFAESIGILLVSFLLTNKIVKSKYAGIISVMIIISSKIFTNNTTAFGYSTEWVFFFILSIYIIYKKPALVGVFFILSLFAKGMTLLFIPVTIYFIYKSDTSKNSKIISIISLLVVVIFAILWTVFAGNHLIQSNISFGINPEEILGTIYTPIYNITEEEDDSLILYLILPITVLGLLAKRRENKLNIPLLIFILYLFSMQIWVPLFSDYNMGSYRMVPMIVFLAIGFASSQYSYLINTKKTKEVK